MGPTGEARKAAAEEADKGPAGEAGGAATEEEEEEVAEDQPSSSAASAGAVGASEDPLLHPVSIAAVITVLSNTPNNLFSLSFPPLL